MTSEGDKADDSEGYTLLDVAEMMIIADAQLRGDDLEISAKNRAMTLALEFARHAAGSAQLVKGRIVLADMNKAIDSLSMLATGAEQMLTIMFLSIASDARRRNTELIISRATEMADKMLGSMPLLQGMSRQKVQEMILDATKTRIALDEAEARKSEIAQQAVARRMN